MKSYVFIAMVICSIIIYPFEAKSQDSGDLRIKSVTLVDGTVISAQNYAATDAAATDELQVKSVEFTDGTIIEADHFEILDQNMKKTGNYFAVAIDEYGGMAGIVTMRDLLELIVGEWKEHDEEPEPSDIEKIGDSLWRIQGAASLDEVAEELDVELPLDEYDTFGGYVLGELCYVPDDGTQVSVLTPDLEIMVTTIKDHRVEETTVRKRIVQEEQT